MQPLIEAQQLQFSYGQHRVLKGIDFTIRPGEIIGLIGENGAGKTTLLSILLGLRQVGRGQVRLWGQQPGSRQVQAHIGSMRQADMRIQGVTVRDLVTLAATRYAHSRQPQALLAELGLRDVANQLLGNLSGGQLRRVMFAVALVGQPELLFLDEPTVGMDANAQQKFWKQIRALKKRGTTVIITSHYLTEIQNVADRILLLQNGQLAFQGTFAELQQQYQEAEIVAQTSLPATTFQTMPGVTAVRMVEGVLHLTSQDADATMCALAPYLNDLRQLTIRRESLTDIFIHLTKQGESA